MVRNLKEQYIVASQGKNTANIEPIQAETGIPIAISADFH
jgi:hypothetical protein